MNVKDKYGHTPLHMTNSIALGAGGPGGHRREFIKLLISNGADVNAKDNNGMTALSYIPNMKAAELLIANGADVNAKDNDGETPLYRAAKGNKNLVELLIANGADVNAKNNAGRSPLNGAIEDGYTEIVELLKKHGAVE